MSEQKPPTAHHSVPVWLSKRFCGVDGLLWWRHHDWPNTETKRSSPRALFYKNNLNTRYAADGSKDVQVENELAEIDGTIASITACLVKQCRQGNSPDLDEENLALLYSYAFVQYKRPPELRENGVGAHNEWVDAVLEPSREVSRVLETKGLSLWSTPPGLALVLGSQVVLRAGSGRPGHLEQSDHGLTFPLASDVLLGFVPGSSRREHHMLSVREIVSVNRATAACCTTIAGPDRLTVLRAGTRYHRSSVQ